MSILDRVLSGSTDPAPESTEDVVFLEASTNVVYCVDKAIKRIYLWSVNQEEWVPSAHCAYPNEFDGGFKYLMSIGREVFPPGPYTGGQPWAS